MEITEVRVKIIQESGERLLAFCSITFDDSFVVRDLKIIEGGTGPFVAMPSRKLTVHCPECGCKNYLKASYCSHCGLNLDEALPRSTREVRDELGRSKLYADIAHPINSTCREMIQRRVILAYEEELVRSRQPGYVPSYTDFADTDDIGETETNLVPSGPHFDFTPKKTTTAPVMQADKIVPPPSDSKESSFGSGIFE